MARLRVAVDFNGVVHDHTDGAMGFCGLRSPEVPGAVQWLKDISEELDVFLISASFVRQPAIEAAKAWLQSRGIPREWMMPANSEQPRITITPWKAPCLMFIDDRGFQFRGEFPSLEQIKAFRPWNR